MVLLNCIFHPNFLNSGERQPFWLVLPAFAPSFPVGAYFSKPLYVVFGGEVNSTASAVRSSCWGALPR